MFDLKEFLSFKLVTKVSNNLFACQLNKKNPSSYEPCHWSRGINPMLGNSWFIGWDNNQILNNLKKSNTKMILLVFYNLINFTFKKCYLNQYWWWNHYEQVLNMIIAIMWNTFKCFPLELSSQNQQIFSSNLNND